MKIFNAVIIAMMLVAGVPSRAAGYTTQNFFEHEAGIAAYFQFSDPTNLQSNLLRNLFRTILTNRDDYLIGFVPEDGLETYPQVDSKVVIHNSGWVVAYYLKELPSGMVFRTALGETLRLERTLAKIAEAMEVSSPEIHYTNFQHPGATTMLLVESVGSSGSTKTFDFRLPATNQYYERSWYIYAWGLLCNLDFTLDNRHIQKVSGLATNSISAGDLVTNAKHVVSLQAGWCNGYFGLAILYSGTDDFSVNYADGIRFIDLPSIPQGLADAGADIALYYLTFLPGISKGE